jgi:hypothetical protein
MVNGSVPDVGVGEDHKLCHVEKRAVCGEDASLFTALLLPIPHAHSAHIKVPIYVKGIVSPDEHFFEDLYKNK